MEAFLYTLDLGLVIYLCWLLCRIDRLLDRPLSARLRLFAYKQDGGRT